MKKYWFTSDTHFGHSNIILYCKRPFLQPGDTIIVDNEERWATKYHARSAARRMDEQLIQNWNQVVSPHDEVFHLGDFNMGGMGNSIEVLRRLNFSKLNFIWGNHDRGMGELWDNINYYKDLKDRINFLGNMAEVWVNGQMIILNHYAMRVWNKSHRGSIHCYGHSHGTLPDDPNSRSFDVGVDCHNLFPIDFETVKTIIEKKNWKPVDHHGKNENVI